MQKSFLIVASIITIVLIALNGFLLYLLFQAQKHPLSYFQCLNSGGILIKDFNIPVCAAPNGQLFINSQNYTIEIIKPSQIPTAYPTRSKPPTHDGCQIGGCSNELCLEQDDTATTSICEIKPHFVCYRNATCARQKNGKCGWTMDSILTACLDTYK
jgi:hypothetical protein